MPSALVVIRTLFKGSKNVFYNVLLTLFSPKNNNIQMVLTFYEH